MIFEKLAAYQRAIRHIGHSYWRGCPLVPKALVADAPLNREAFNQWIDEIGRLALTDVKTIWDIGANRGEVASAAATLFPEADIYLFEPLPRLRPILEKRVQKHGATWHFEPYAMGKESGEAEFHIDSNQDAVGSLCGFSEDYLKANPKMGTTSTVKTQVKTVDEVRREKGIASIDLMKVDVEGFEFELFEGAHETLPVTRALMVELSTIRQEKNAQSTISRFTNLLDTYGFTLIEIVPSFPKPDGSPAEYNALARRW